ncbi:hypothetical protein [Salinibius halmophilus]|uniref:hypothetical protein n=1 Tax=Salinibius halmophilus TaxID=1853216 RepID=UPI000E66644D|nr:hypothetical protein [Salinibius halmophilus]
MKKLSLISCFALAACGPASNSGTTDGAAAGGTAGDSADNSGSQIILENCDWLAMDGDDSTATIFCGSAITRWQKSNTPIEIPNPVDEYAYFSDVRANDSQVFVVAEDDTRLFELGTSGDLTEWSLTYNDETLVDFANFSQLDQQFWLSVSNSEMTETFVLGSDGTLTQAMSGTLSGKPVSLIESYSQDVLWVYQSQDKVLYKQTANNSQQLDIDIDAEADFVADQLNNRNYVFAGDNKLLLLDPTIADETLQKYDLAVLTSSGICTSSVQASSLHNLSGDVVIKAHAWDESSNTLFVLHQQTNEADYNDSKHVVNSLTISDDCETTAGLNLAESSNKPKGIFGASVNGSTVAFWGGQVISSDDGFETISEITATEDNSSFIFTSLDKR